MKFALVSHAVPPSGAGQSVIISRLLEVLNPGSYCLITTQCRETAGPNTTLHELPGHYHYLPKPFHFVRGHRFGLRYVREGINIPLAVRHQARRITRIVEEEACQAIVACTGDITLLPAAYLASRRAGIPLYAYIFDHYSDREWEEPSAAYWARRFEPAFMKGAMRVIAPNETLRDDLRRRFGIDPKVIHNSLDISPYQTDGQAPAPDLNCDREVSIVYTGQIYDAHYDAFRNLIKALTSLERDKVKLHLYTDRAQAELELEGIGGPVVYHGLRSAADMPRVQMTGDILFLPLAFNSPYPNLVKTSATTKLGEYLAARRPVLVHAPPDSFISWYFREHDCGVVVDESNPARLAEGVQRILDDAELQQRLSKNAWARAVTDFDIVHSRAAFAELLGLEAGNNK